MLVLFETSSGYAFFKLLDEKKIQTADNIYKDFETPEGASKVVKLKHFQKFLDTTEALASTTAAVEGKLSKTLKKALKKIVSKEVQDKLLVADAKLGSVIKEKLSLSCVANSAVMELIRCIRSQSENLLSGLSNKDSTAMSLGLAHSLSRYKLKFSPDKIDTMIIQAIGLLDELDKELNNYAMRCREWYGWHFPELGIAITDNIVFAKIVKLVGTRDKIRSTDLSDILPEDKEEEVKGLADFSMGTEITDGDMLNIHQLCDQVIEIHTYRTDLYEYLRSRMMAIAPNLTVLLGELIGARLISHAGSLVNLAKHPASTVQILGAEKALFRALKTKKDTPKFGLIYHSQLVSQASAKIKGKASRMLATKAALAIRFDALGEDSSGMDLGAEHKAKLEEKIRLLEEGNLKRISGTAKSKAAFQKYHSKSEVLQYPTADDSTLPSKKRKFEEDKKPLIEEYEAESFSSSPKKKKQKLEEQIKIEVKSEDENEVEVEAAPKKKKKKVKDEIKIEVEPEIEDVEAEGLKKRKKKKIKQEAEEQPVVQETHSVLDESISKKKKKKKIKEEPVYELMDVEDLNVELKGKKKKKKKATKQEIE